MNELASELVKRSRDFSWLARLATVAGLIVFGALLLGAQPGSAAPVAPVIPTEIAVPTAPPLPPKPPCHAVLKCQPPTFEPCFVAPGELCQPPTTTTTTTTTKPPTLTPRPSTSHPAATPTDPPTGIPTPNRIDTGGGSTQSGTPVWLFWLVPGFAVVALGAALAGWWLARSDQSLR